MGMPGHNPRIGLIADSTLQSHLLATAIRAQGFDLAVNTDPQNMDPKWFDDQSLQLWVVDLTAEDKWAEFIDRLLEQVDVPILFCDGEAPARTAPDYPRWERRLMAKMVDYVGRPVIQEKLESLEPVKPKITIPTPREFSREDVKIPAGGTPRRVWVLGASLGGPAAVKLFLDCLPPGLPVAFVLAQHIDGSFLETLTKVLTRDNHMRCAVGYEGELLEHGKVLIAPVEYEIQFTREGRVMSTGKDWEGPYAPSIDQVIHNTAMTFGAHSGAILFSGMGNDGSIAAPVMQQQGGQIWAQTAESCAVSSQPDAVRETGCVSYSGTPEQLALQIVELARKQIQAHDRQLSEGVKHG